MAEIRTSDLLSYLKSMTNKNGTIQQSALRRDTTAAGSIFGENAGYVGKLSGTSYLTEDDINTYANLDYNGETISSGDTSIFTGAKNVYTSNRGANPGLTMAEAAAFTQDLADLADGKLDHNITAGGITAVENMGEVVFDDANNEVTTGGVTYKVDDSGRIIGKVTIDSVTGDKTTKDLEGNIKEIKHKNGDVDKYTYANNQVMISSKNKETGITTETSYATTEENGVYQYDTNSPVSKTVRKGNKIQSSWAKRADGSEITREYYENGKPKSTQLKNADGSWENTEYAESGLKTSSTKVDKDGNKTEEEYGLATGKLRKSTTTNKADGTVSVSSYSPETGKLTNLTVTQADGTVTTSHYSPSTGKLINMSIKQPDGTTLTSKYDKDGNLVSATIDNKPGGLNKETYEVKNGYIVHTRPDGTSEKFKLQADGTYKRLDPNTLELSQESFVWDKTQNAFVAPPAA